MSIYRSGQPPLDFSHLWISVTSGFQSLLDFSIGLQDAYLEGSTSPSIPILEQFSGFLPFSEKFTSIPQYLDSTPSDRRLKAELIPPVYLQSVEI